MGNETSTPFRVELIRAASTGILQSEGDLDPGVRAAVFAHAASVAGRPLDVGGATELREPLAGFVDKVTRNAYRVVDADVDALRAAGCSEDAVFEAILATAIGAGVARLEIGIAAITGEG